ncbi:MAG TPA: GNAT family N-acetyltransferase [Actinopolymorphaceae bacterium]|nr:GNAT family N-acetyltransferase [Actinopolymorphaceae bacterium]
MDLQYVDPDDADAMAASLALSAAAHPVDEPWDPPPMPRAHAAFVRNGWDGEPAKRWLLRDGSGNAIAQLSVDLPERENRHSSGLGVLVHPDKRREGLGRAVFEEGLARVRASGRRQVISETHDAPGPNAFAEGLGFTRASVDVQRRQDLTAVDNDRVDRLRKEALEAASDYTLLRIVGAVPDGLLDQVVTMTAAINDAPTDDLDIEDDVFDPQRIRSFETTQELAGNRLYRLVARLGTDGPLAGHTMVGVPSDLPGWSWQYDTAVLAAHRGHKLGLLLKAEMMAWLTEAEPDVRWVDTWNAESNTHMIAVNAALGYEIVTRYVGWQRKL